VRYTELAPDRFKNFWWDWNPNGRPVGSRTVFSQAFCPRMLSARALLGRAIRALLARKIAAGLMGVILIALNG